MKIFYCYKTIFFEIYVVFQSFNIYIIYENLLHLLFVVECMSTIYIYIYRSAFMPYIVSIPLKVEGVMDLNLKFRFISACVIYWPWEKTVLFFHTFLVLRLLIDLLIAIYTYII